MRPLRRTFPLGTARWALLAGLAAAAACVRTLNIPRPTLGAGAALPPLQPSRIDVPLTAEVRGALTLMESQVPPEIDAMGRWSMIPGTPVGVRYRVRRAPFQFSPRPGGALHAETTLAISAEACLGSPVSLPLLGDVCQPVASCGVGEAPRQVVVSADTTLRLDSQWRLVSETRPGAPVFRTPCLLTAFHIDVTGIVAEMVAAQMAEAAQHVDASIAARGDMRPRAQAIWSALQAPVALGEGFWLALHPQTMHAGPLALDTTTLRTTVGITALPHVVAGARPPSDADTALPLLEPGAAGTSSAIQITLDAAVSFADATAMVARELRGTTIALEGHRVLVRDIRVEGRGGALFFAIDVRFADGPFSNSEGTVYLAGLPFYDAATGMLAVRDLDYTLETRNGLLSAAEWLMQGSLRDSLARRARWPMRERIERLRRGAETALRRELGAGAVLTGRLTSVRPLGAYVTETGVVLRAVAEGSAEITQDLSQTPFGAPAP